ncbi:MAG: PD40 domain-containing protein [Ardenticatenaceae bacterium]|nr:PD40 domain-containing protein [Anaerolineales bacterium]MCB8920008.1 PD40 domain-containing protein [Ardenticatenaceae bacterium]
MSAIEPDGKQKVFMACLIGFLLLIGCREGGLPVLSDEIDPEPAPGVEPTTGIVFVTTRHVERQPGALHQNWELYLVQPDGSGLTRLTDNDRVDTSPSWSPDGRQIVYRSRVAGSSDILIMHADGTNIRNLVQDPEDSIDDEFYPRWQPDGDMIALYTDRFYDPSAECAWHRLAIMPVTGGKDNIQVLDAHRTEQETLTWSPDGRSIVYSSRCDMTADSSVDLFQWNIETDKVTQVVNDDYINAAPVFSHNGRFLAYHSVREGNTDIFILDLETGELVNITDHPAKDSYPTWSPDDSQVAFVSDRDGNDDIFVMNADGSNPRNITNHPAKDFEPAWSPAP